MIATAVLVAGLAMTGQCMSDTPGPLCPPAGQRHAMVGMVGGRKLVFIGWHDATGVRRYQRGENVEFDSAVAEAAKSVVAPLLAGKNYGLNLADVQPGESGTIRTDDPNVGAALNDTLAQSAARPCPNPGPCPDPNPTPEVGPAPTSSSHTFLVVGAGVVLGMLGLAVLFLAVLTGVLVRKGPSS